MDVCCDCRQKPPRTEKSLRCKECKVQRDKLLFTLRAESAESLGMCTKCIKRKAIDGIRCSWCRARARASEQKRKPNKGVYKCGICKKTGHNWQSCPENDERQP